ncbi:hypothetical protein FRX31_014602, partial [Thalictrum thalictroides]
AAAGPVGRALEADLRAGDRGSGMCYTYSLSKATMSSHNDDDDDKDNHDHDMVMPGFRFHPTEEELIEFYLTVSLIAMTLGSFQH